VTHRIDPFLLCVTTPGRTVCSGGLPAFARTVAAEDAGHDRISIQ
jgi:hypothetical protein